MTYNSVADIYAVNDKIRRRLVAHAESVDPARHTSRPAPEAWAVAEIVEHLAMIEERVVVLAEKLLQKAEGEATATTTGGATSPASAFTSFSMDEFTETVRDKQLSAPEVVRPQGNTDVSASLASLEQSRAALHALRPRIEAVDLSAARFPHPILGPLNLYQWLAVTGLHEARHLQQLERLSPGNDQRETTNAE